MKIIRFRIQTGKRGVFPGAGYCGGATDVAVYIIADISGWDIITTGSDPVYDRQVRVYDPLPRLAYTWA
jgi:hypothetical protein